MMILFISNQVQTKLSCLEHSVLLWRCNTLYLLTRLPKDGRMTIFAIEWSTLQLTGGVQTLKVFRFGSGKWLEYFSFRFTRFFHIPSTSLQLSIALPLALCLYIKLFQESSKASSSNFASNIKQNSAN